MEVIRLWEYYLKRIKTFDEESQNASMKLLMVGANKLL